MKIKNVILPGYAALAPMAGVADIAFRELCIEFGAGYTVTEMVSAKGFILGDRKSRALMNRGETEHPAAVQLFGCDPKIIAEAAKGCENDFHPEIIDINMGCPAPKIAGNGGGSALLKDLPLAERIIKATVKAVETPVTVKIRTGWDESENIAVEMAKRAEEAGAAAITVHGRNRRQMYAPPVDRQSIAAVKEAVNIPVIANGDVADAESAKAMIEKTGADYLMVGRGALGRPWVFKQINEYFENGILVPEPDIDERMDVMVRHIGRIVELKGERVGMREARKHAAWYIRGSRGAAQLRREAGTLQSMDELEWLAERAKAILKEDT